MGAITTGWPAMLVVCIGFPAVMVILALIFRRFIGCTCICGRRMKFFKELSEGDKREVLSYFENVEKRSPDLKGIFVCEHCRRVYDDFSGEKKSLSADNVSLCKICQYDLEKLPVTYLGNFVGFPGYADVYNSFVEKNRGLVDKIECLRCQRHPSTTSDCVQCDSPTKVYGCPHCFTLYMWARIGQSKYQFVVPLTTETVLKQAIDPTPGWL